MTLDLDAPFSRTEWKELEKKAEVTVYKGLNAPESVVGYLNLTDILELENGSTCIDLSKLAFGSSIPDDKRRKKTDSLRANGRCIQLCDSCSPADAYGAAIGTMNGFANYRGFITPDRETIIMIDQTLKGAEIFKYALAKKGWIERHSDKTYSVNSWSRPGLTYMIRFEDIEHDGNKFPRFRTNHNCMAKSYFASDRQQHIDFGLLCKHEAAALLYAAYCERDEDFSRTASFLPVPSSLLNSMIDVMRRQKTIDSTANEVLIEALSLKIVKCFGVPAALSFSEPGEYLVKKKEDLLKRLAVAAGFKFA